MLITLLLARCIYPTLRQQCAKNLAVLLQQVTGCSKSEADEKVGGISDWMMLRCLQDPQALVTVPRFTERALGRETALEIGFEEDCTPCHVLQLGCCDEAFADGCANLSRFPA